MVDLDIGKKLRSLRKAKSMTTQELADKVNVSQSYISRFENNRAVPDIDMLAKILTALDTDLSSFFSLDSGEMSEDLIELMNTAKSLSKEERIKLNEFLKVVKKNNQENH